MAGNGVNPSIIALVVCDNIYVEQGGKTALVGLFNSISASTFPAMHSRLAIFVSLTGVRPKTTAKLDIVFGETDQPIVEATGGFGKEINPLTVVDMTFILRNVIFPQPGPYFIRFFGNEHPLATRPFAVLQQQGGPS